MTPAELLGYKRMTEAVSTGEDLRMILFRLLKGEQGSVDLKQALFTGALECIFATYLAIRKAGRKIAVVEPSLQPFVKGSRARIMCDILESAHTGNHDLLQRQIEALCSTISANRSGISYSMPTPSLAVASGPKPIDIRLVAMPARVSTTDFVRDPSTLEIVSNSTRQIDAVA